MEVDGNEYDGHTLKPQLDQIKELTEGKVKKVIIDITLKHDHMMLMNYLGGNAGDKINTLLAAAACIMKKPTCYRNPEIEKKCNSCGFDQAVKSKLNV